MTEEEQLRILRRFRAKIQPDEEEERAARELEKNIDWSELIGEE